MEKDFKVPISFTRKEFMDLIELLNDIKHLTKSSNPVMMKRAEEVMSVVRKSYFGINDSE